MANYDDGNLQLHKEVKSQEIKATPEFATKQGMGEQFSVENMRPDPMYMEQKKTVQVEGEKQWVKDYLNNASNEWKTEFRFDYLPENSVLLDEYKGIINHELTANLRAEKSNDVKSRLYIKKNNAETLDENAKQWEVERLANLDNLNITHEEWDTKYRNALSYFDIKVSNNESLFDKLTDAIMQMNVDSLHLDSDAAISQNAQTLERLLGQITQYDKLIKTNPEFFGNMDEKLKKAVIKKIDVIRTVAEYYRVRKEIILDDYYKTHYNEELSMEIDTGNGDGEVSATEQRKQRELAEKMIESFVLGEKLLRINGKDLTGQGKNGEVMFKSSISQSLYSKYLALYSTKEKLS